MRRRPVPGPWRAFYRVGRRDGSRAVRAVCGVLEGQGGAAVRSKSADGRRPGAGWPTLRCLTHFQLFGPAGAENVEKHVLTLLWVGSLCGVFALVVTWIAWWLG